MVVVAMDVGCGDDDERGDDEGRDEVVGF